MPPLAEARIRVLAVEDHPIMREGLATALREEDDIDLVAQAGTGEQAISLFQVHAPDLVLVDLRLPDMSGVDVIRRMRALSSQSHFIVLTTYEGDVRASQAIAAGATGYLLKASLGRNLTDAIRTVHAGGFSVPPEIATQLARSVSTGKLTEREVQILREIAAGCSNKIIADHLSISEDTVKGHVRSILAKLKANDRTHAVTIGMRRGFIDL